MVNRLFDQQQIAAIAYCTMCGGEIYPGEPYYSRNRYTYCEECAYHEINRMISNDFDGVAAYYGLERRCEEE